MKLAARNYLTLREFGIAIPRVRGAAHTTHNPLPRIAAKMKHQIADAVRLVVRPPPDLIVVEALKAPFDLRQEVID